MSTPKILEICDLVSSLNTEKANLATFCQEVVDFILPDRSNVTKFTSPGERRGVTRYDSTGPEAAEILAGNMAATLTPQGSVWLDLQLANEKKNKVKRVREWLQKTRDDMLSSMFKSNFYLAMDELYLDLVGFCTACPYTEMIDNRLHYQVWPIREYVFTTGIDGRARGVYRKFKMTAENVVTRFKAHPGLIEFGPSVTKTLAENATAQDKLKMVTIIHAIYPRETYDPRKRSPKNMPIASCYINVDDKVIIAEGGYEEMPANIVRWRVNSDDAGWGRGPSHTAMPDIRSLNAVKRMMHRAAAKDLDPPLVVENKGVVGSIRTAPNGITYVRREARFEYLTSGQRMDLAQFDLAGLQQQVRAVFFSDHLRLPPPQAQPMTATEIQLRWELMERLLGPTLGRLQVELLNPIIERTFGLMMRAGMLDQPPPEVMDEDINIEYVGPLARAQQMPEITAIERTYQLAGNLAAVTGNRNVFARLNDDAALQRGAILSGCPAGVLRDDDEVAQIRQQNAEQAQGMQDRQDAMLAADVASKVPVQAAA